MARKPTVVTVMRGRTGFNAEYLASMNQKDAVKAFKGFPAELIKDVHREAVKLMSEK